MTEGAKKHERAAGGGINVRDAVWLAWAFVALSVALFIASGVLYVLGRSAQFPVDWAKFLAEWVLFLAYPIVDALIASRRLASPESQ